VSPSALLFWFYLFILSSKQKSKKSTAACIAIVDSTANFGERPTYRSSIFTNKRQPPVTSKILLESFLHDKVLHCRLVSIAHLKEKKVEGNIKHYRNNGKTTRPTFGYASG